MEFVADGAGFLSATSVVGGIKQGFTFDREAAVFTFGAGCAGEAYGAQFRNFGSLQLADGLRERRFVFRDEFSGMSSAETTTGADCGSRRELERYSRLGNIDCSSATGNSSCRSKVLPVESMIARWIRHPQRLTT